jgi:hypothetical protein
MENPAEYFTQLFTQSPDEQKAASEQKNLPSSEEKLETVVVGSRSKTFNINEFRTELNVNGVLRNHSFTLIMSPPLMFNESEQFKTVFGDETFGDPIQNPDLRNLVMRCESVTIPGVNFFTSDNIRRYGYGPIERRPYLPQFNPITATFVVDRAAEVIRYFHLWNNGIMNHDVFSNGIHGNVDNFKSKPYFLNYKDNYISPQLTIFVYDEKLKQSFVVKLRDAYPLTTTDISMAWGATDDVIRYSVTFMFTDMAIDFLQTSATGGYILGKSSDLPGFSSGKGIIDKIKNLANGKIYSAQEKIVNKILKSF